MKAKMTAKKWSKKFAALKVRDGKNIIFKSYLEESKRFHEMDFVKVQWWAYKLMVAAEELEAADKAWKAIK